MKSFELKEASPDTLPGSFTNDLIISKKWLCNYIKLIQKQSKKPFSTITLLGSWYGNLGLFLTKDKIKFDRMILIDLDKDNLDVSKTLLGNINYYKILPIIKDANDHVYSNEPNQLVINTSCNDMENKSWLNNIPAGCLVALQGRNSVQSVPVTTETIYDFNEKFPLSKTMVLKQRNLQDPESKYTRFLKIGIK